MTELRGLRSEWWREAAVLGGVLLVAAALRFYDLVGESLWYDEAYSVWSSAMDIGSLRILWAWQIEFPLYYWLLHYWMSLWGQSEWAVRSFGAVAGVLAMIPMYYWARTLFGRHTAILAALLLALSPWHVWYAQEVRMYAWAMLLTLGSLWAFARIMRGARWGWWLSYVLLTGLVFHLHYYIGWIVLAQNVCFLAKIVRQRSLSSRRTFWRATRVWLVAQLGVLLLALPALAVFRTKLLTHNQWDWLAQRYAAPNLHDLADLFGAYTLGTTFVGPGWLRWACVGVAALLAIWAGWRVWRQHGTAEHETGPRAGLLEAGLMLALPVGLLIVLGQFTTVWVPRYLILFMPAWLVLIARGLDMLPWKSLAAGALVLLTLGQFLSLGEMYSQRQKEDWRGVAAYLAAQAKQGDLLVLMDEECRVPFDYYASGPGLTRVEVGRFSDAQALDAAVQTIVARRQGGRVWLVVSHADSDGLEQRLEQLPNLNPVGSPSFVGIRLVAYDGS